MKSIIAIGWVVIFSLTFYVFAFAQEEEEIPTTVYIPQFPSTLKVNIYPLEAGLFTGEAYTSVPIELPYATGDIEKKLALTLQYRSGGEDSWVGNGWELEPGYITRSIKFGGDNPENPYILCFNGAGYELISVGNNEYRTKIESHMRIKYDGDKWYVGTTEGTEYTFGLKSCGKWVLTKVKDTHGISIGLQYYNSNEQLYLTEISYPQGEGLTSYCSVKFQRETRSDSLITYGYGELLKINDRLKEIQVYADGNLQKKYELNYTTNGVTKRSLLSSVVEYGKNGENLPLFQFSYIQPVTTTLGDIMTAIADTEDLFTHNKIYSTPPESIVFDSVRFENVIVDVTGDGINDFVGCRVVEAIATSKMQREYRKTFKSEWVVYRGTTTGFSSTPEVWLDKEYSYFLDKNKDIYEPITLGYNGTLAEINGDGLVDLVYSIYGGLGGYESACDIMVRYNTGSKFSDTAVELIDYKEIIDYIKQDVNSLKVGSTAFFEDFNGDGRDDLLFYRLHAFLFKENPNGAPTKIWGVSYDWVVRFNNGNGFSKEENIWLKWENAYFESTSFAKYHPDEFTPLHNPKEIESNTIEIVKLGKNATLTDMNNDGLVDLVYNDFANVKVVWNDVSEKNNRKEYYAHDIPTYNWKVRYNTGKKFSDEVVTLISDAGYSYYKYSCNWLQVSSNYQLACNYKFYRIRLGENGIIVDMNSDKFPDLVYNIYIYEEGDKDVGTTQPKAKWCVRYNKGKEFSEPFIISDNLGYIYKSGGNDRYIKVSLENVLFADVNADGNTDLIYPHYIQPIEGLGYFSCMSFNLVAKTNLNPIDVDLLNVITPRYGGVVKVTYTSSSQFTHQKLPFVIPLVKNITNNPGIDSAGVTNFDYEGGLYDFANLEFKGFKHVTTTDPLGYVHRTYFHQDDPRLGKVEKEENSIKKVYYTYKEDSSAPYWTPVTQVDEYTDSKCERIVYDYDDYGNIKQTTYYGDKDNSGDERSVFTDYALNTSSWLLNLPSRERVFSGISASGSPLRETLYLYDNNSEYTATPSKGDLTKVKQYLNTKNGYIQTASVYDSYGNETEKTDANGNKTTIQYDGTYHSFPVSLTNAKGHIEKMEYYLPSETGGLFGQLKAKTDSNGNKTSFHYDGFGRKTKVIGPYDTGSSYGSEAYEYGINGPGNNYILTRTTEENGTSKHLVKVAIFDGFQRVIQTAQESENENQYSYVTTIYNKRGEVEKVSLPYFKDGGLRTSYLACDGLEKWTTNTYDAIGRITNISKPDGTTISNSYSGWTTTVTDENNHQRVLEKDAFDRLIKVTEKNKGESYNTGYSYDVLNNLIKIVDNSGNNTGFTYDTLSRRTAMNDPDLGSWSYSYDDAGNLIQQTDANNNIISFTYDSLNRLTTKRYEGPIPVNIGHGYDESFSTNSMGRRTSMQDLSGTAQWYYDKEGRVTKEVKAIDGNNYPVERTYDAMGRVKSITYPNSQTVNFTYNNAGSLETVDGYCSGSEYNASGQVTAMDFNNSTRTNFTYYPDNLRLKQIWTSALQNLNYEYDSAGNVKKITDSLRSTVKNYDYDDLDRLISGDGNSYEYNSIGNLVRKNGAGFGYNSPHPHAVTSDGQNTYSYDSVGNIVSGAGRTITYDSENRPIKITKDNVTTYFIYDGDGERVKKVVEEGLQKTTTLYIDDLYEVEFSD